MAAFSPDENPDLLKNILMGIGTWSWGDRLYWEYGRDHKEEDVEQAFKAGIEGGIRLFDTAEVYGQGKSESLLGNLIKKFQKRDDILVATKFMPYPWRLGKGSMKRALDRSLKRLGLAYVDIFQIHWPSKPVNIETWMEAFLELHHMGKIKSCGVSNYNREQMQRAYDALIQGGLRLTSNQVEYNLLNRQIEKNGLLQHAKELGVRIIAYSPLSMGILSGKYSSNNPPHGIRGERFSNKYLVKISPLLDLMKKIGSENGGKTQSQVALNWIISKGAIPIPGVKNLFQIQQNLGALGWMLPESAIAMLDECSDQVLRGNSFF